MPGDDLADQELHRVLQSLQVPAAQCLPHQAAGAAGALGAGLQEPVGDIAGGDAVEAGSQQRDVVVAVAGTEDVENLIAQRLQRRRGDDLGGGGEALAEHVDAAPDVPGAGLDKAVGVEEQGGTDGSGEFHGFEGHATDGLLGADALALARLVAAERGEPLSLAATRMWGAVETLRKAGRAVAALSLDDGADMPAGWVAFRGGTHRIATFTTALAGVADPVAFSVLTEEEG